MKKTTKNIRLCFLTLLIIVSVANPAAPQNKPPKGNSKASSGGAVILPGLLSKSKLNYAKVAENVWEIQFTGQNVRQFSVRIVTTDDLVLMMVKLADRKDVTGASVLMTKLLELNDKVDQVKFALSA